LRRDALVQAERELGRGRVGRKLAVAEAAVEVQQRRHVIVREPQPVRRGEVRADARGGDGLGDHDHAALDVEPDEDCCGGDTVARRYRAHDRVFE
jgi:hypothetical protein